METYLCASIRLTCNTKTNNVTARANMIYGNLSKADDLSSVNNHQSGGSPYTQTTPIAKRAVSYGGEVGFNLRAVCKDNMSVPVIYPFVRYEYYNPQEKAKASTRWIYATK